MRDRNALTRVGNLASEGPRTGRDVYECPICGAAVTAPSAHHEWHVKSMAALVRAQYPDEAPHKKESKQQ